MSTNSTQTTSMSDGKPTIPRLPPGLRYSVYASMVEHGVATLWDANARKRDGTYVAGASGETPADAIDQLAKELANVKDA